MKLTAYLPTPKLIVGVAVTLALLTFLLTMARNSPWGQKLRAYMGLSFNQAQMA